MNQISENIKQTFANMLQIYEELANLLLDADDLMGQNGYKNLKGSAIETGSSRSLNFPRWWVTHAGVRYYVTEETPLVAKAIGVFFMDVNLEPIEPIIVFSTMWRDGGESEPEIDPSWVLWDAWNKSIEDKSPGVEHHFGELRNVTSGKLKAVMLEKVNDRESLQQLVIDPLLDMEWK